MHHSIHHYLMIPTLFVSKNQSDSTPFLSFCKRTWETFQKSNSAHRGAESTRVRVRPYEENFRNLLVLRSREVNQNLVNQKTVHKIPNNPIALWRRDEKLHWFISLFSSNVIYLDNSTHLVCLDKSSHPDSLHISWVSDRFEHIGGWLELPNERCRVILKVFHISWISDRSEHIAGWLELPKKRSRVIGIVSRMF